VRSRSKKVPAGARLANDEQAPAGATFGRADTGPIAGPGQNGRSDGPEPGGTPQQQAPVSRPAARGGLKNWRVRSRLLLLITIPTLTAVVLGGIRIASSVQSALAYQRVHQLAVLSSDVANLVGRLQAERDQTAYFIAEGRTGGRAASAGSGATGLQVVYTQRRDTEKAAAVVEADLAQVGGSFASLTRQEASTALTDLAGLPNLRLAATQTQLPALVVVQKYGILISDLLVLEENTAQGASDATLSQTVRQLGLVSRMKEDASQQRAILAAALIQGGLGPDELQALTAAQSDQNANLGSFNLSATNAQRELWNNSVSRSLAPLASSEEQQAIALQSTAGSLRTDPSTADDWYGAMSNVVDFQMGSVERTLLNTIITRTVTLRNQAVVSALVIAVAVMLVLGLALLFTVVVARSMVRPLRRLRAGALEVAGVRLPETVRRMSESDGSAAPLDVEPIDVDSSDEIGEVARAFDQVHREALRLASNEAALRGNVNAMFVNLSRRSQSLVERQIRLIDDLEQGEQDAERLANLFQMDHLATRMRRNSENLLVLAGHEVSRRWTQSVALVDVLRAAVSEIEQYERVTLNVQPGISVRGQAVNDVVHLIAELAENASSFSAADTPVKVSGHLLNSGGVLLDITDQGVGMGAEEMAHANWRLDNPPVVDVAVSRRMGLFVVARLAARHGIRVRLRPASVGGLTALVWLPDEVISHESGTAPSGLRRVDMPQPGMAAAPSTSTTGSFGTDWPGDSSSADRSAAAEAVSAARAPRFAPLRPDLGDTAAFTAVGSDLDAPAPASASAYDITADTGTGPAYGGSSTQAYESAGTSAYEPAGTYEPAGGSVYDAAGTSAYDPGSASMLGTGAMPTVGATGPLPVFGAPTRSEEQFTRGEDDLPFRREASQSQRGVIVPPAVSSAEGHRLPIFESVESDWFRRGRHGAGRTGQVASAVGASWTSPADEGWRAAEAAHAPTAGGITISGLPKRVPKANLVPGTVGGDSAHAPSVPAPARSAAQARERLASFQRGMREGRAAVRDGEVPGGEDNSAI
jgi:signal transduction histidine kinase